MKFCVAEVEFGIDKEKKLSTKCNFCIEKAKLPIDIACFNVILDGFVSFE